MSPQDAADAGGAAAELPPQSAADAGSATVELPLQAAPDGGTELGVAAADGGSGPVVVPPALLQDSPAHYPPELAAQGASGVVQLELLVNAQGEVAEAKVAQPVQPLLDEAALQAATGLRFSPATVDGVPSPVRLTFEYRFVAPQPAPEGSGTLSAAEAPRPVSLSGQVRAKGNRRPLAGAVIVEVPIEVSKEPPAAEQLLGESGADGHFEVRLAPGEHTLRVTAPGYRPGVFQERVRSGEVLQVLYALEPLVVNPYETVVRAERPRTEVSRVTLHDQELREVPGTMGDPFRVVMLMPGVGSMLSGVAYPVVRGGQPSSTGYFLDGIRVPLLFHLFLGPAILHPDFIDTIDFYAGNPPAQYGRQMGGAIDGRLSRPHDDRVHGSAYADLINAGLFIEYPFQSTGTNVSLAGRFSYTPWLVGLAATKMQAAPPPGQLPQKVVLDFYDYQARVEQRIRGGGRLRLFAFGSSDAVGLKAQDALSDTAMQTVLFHRVDLRHTQPVGRGELELGVTWGLDRFGIDNIRRSEAPDAGDAMGSQFAVDQYTYAARLGFTHPLAQRLSLRSGADVEQRRAAVSLDTLVSTGTGREPRRVSEEQPRELATFSGVWSELLWEPTARLTLTPGLRLDNYHLVSHGGLNALAVEPRLSARLRASDTVTLKAGAGIYHQTPTTLISLPVVDLAGLPQGLQRALQLSGGVEYTGWRLLNLSVDAYVNPLVRTVEMTPFADETLQDRVDRPDPGDGRPNDIPELPDLSSHGLAYGVELMLRHPLGGNWFGWLSYSLSRSTRFTRFYRYDARGRVVGEASEDLPFAFDQTHILNLVLSRKFAHSFTLGGVFHFNTGRPENGLLGAGPSQPGFDSEGSPEWVPLDRDRAERLPGFVRLDVRIAKSWAYDAFTLEAYLDMLNVTLSREVTGFDYSVNALTGQYSKRPSAIPVAIPILGVKGRY
ncbi:TonB family protein [Aggregicoccus sp. 17bor-14]|nr:TonB family protein [Simulacricoccus sp. 17bor-14]MRI91744.1 TonB family protein [Aggregicoccus sp. 17bor-14]